MNNASGGCHVFGPLTYFVFEIRGGCKFRARTFNTELDQNHFEGYRVIWSQIITFPFVNCPENHNTDGMNGLDIKCMLNTKYTLNKLYVKHKMYFFTWNVCWTERMLDVKLMFDIKWVFHNLWHVFLSDRCLFSNARGVSINVCAFF